MGCSVRIGTPVGYKLGRLGSCCPRACAFAHYLATLLLPAPVCRKRSISREKVSIRTRSVARRCTTHHHIHKKNKWISIVNLTFRSQVPFPPRRPCIISTLRMTSLKVVCVRG